MEYVKFFRLCGWVVLLVFLGACNDDDAPVQIAAPQLSDAQDISSNGFTVSWSEVSNADSYLLDVSTLENFSAYVEGYNKKEVTGLSETIEDLESATVYYFRVYAVAGSVASVASAAKEVMTDGPIPAPELNDAEDITTSAFMISWSEVEQAEAYQLDVATDESFDTKVEGYDRKEIAGLSELVEDLEAGTTYYVRVFAIQGELESLPSSVKEVTTEEE